MLKASVATLLDGLLLELAGSRDHVGGPSTCREAALTFRQMALLQVLQPVIEEDSRQDLACYNYRKEGDTSAVVTGLAVSSPLVNVGNCSISKLLR